MKILHISTSSGGGAGTAARRLHQGLLKEGVSSKFLCLQNKSPLVHEIYTIPTPKKSSLTRISRKLGAITQEDKNRSTLKSLAGNYEIFTFPRTDYKVHLNEFLREANIIHLHWIAGMVDYNLFSKVSKPIVWTLHDMNPFQGGFHYKNDEECNTGEFGEIDNNIKEMKLSTYKKASIKMIVAPSKWLINTSKASKLLGDFPHKYIPYGVDIRIFQSHDQHFARQVFELPSNKLILLFVSENVGNERKGFKLLLEAIQDLESDDFILVAIGKNPINSNRKIRYLGTITDERLLALAYAAADAFILPSREDNLPNVMLESLACGTPVIATPVGGMLDVIRDGFNGYLAEALTSESLRAAIRRFLDNVDIFNRENIREDAVKKFSLKVQAREYLKLYRAIHSKEL